MATGDFDLYYSDEPFSIMDQNQRSWLDPILADVWRQTTIFRGLIKFQKSFENARATSMTTTAVLDPHPDFTALSMRQIWSPSLHLDSRSVTITFQRYGSKVAYHKYDDMITYWQKAGAKPGMAAIARGSLGINMVDINDMLARNAMLDAALDSGYAMYAGSATSFSSLATTDKFDFSICKEINLGMIYRGVPGIMNPDARPGQTIVCYTSPGVIYDIQDDADWTSIMHYANPTTLLNYEVGAYKNIRFVQHPRCTLWNCGTVTARAPINAAANAGDGSPDPATTKVDGTYAVGQTSAGITHYISLGTFTAGSASDINVNDIITIHKTTTNAYGVTGGVDFQEGTAMNRRVISKTVQGANLLLTLDVPILLDYNQDLGSGVYGYVTKGRNIHSSIFVGGGDALVAGVQQQPQYYALDPIDDYKSIYRFSWDQYLGYNLNNPEVMEVVFTAGTTRVKGRAAVQ